MPAAPPQKASLHGKPATTVVRADIPLLACWKEDLLGLGRSVSRAGCVSPETDCESPLAEDGCVESASGHEPLGRKRQEPLLSLWHLAGHKDAPGLIVQVGREKQASCLPRSELC